MKKNDSKSPKLSLVKLQITKLHNLQKIRGGGIGLSLGVINNDDDDDGSDTWVLTRNV